MQALEWHGAIKQYGWEQTVALRTLRLAEQEAEALSLRLRALDELIPAMRAAYFGTEG